MSLERAKDLVELFNDGEYETEIQPYFNKILTFLNFLKKYNLLLDIDLESIPNDDFTNEVYEFLEENDVLKNLDYDSIPEQFKNHYLLYQLENNYEDTVVYITSNLLTDVQIRSDGFYLYLKYREDLSEFFCTRSRDTSPEDIAKNVLGDDSLDYGYFDNDVKPSEVIENLDDKNITYLKDYIYKQIGDKELSLSDYSSDFFHSLHEEQKTTDYFKIRAEDLDGLVNDDDAINELCKEELDELYSNLSGVYWNAENSSYESEIYDLVYDGLKEYFEGRILEEPKVINEKTKYYNYIKIKDFISHVEDFLNLNKGGTYSDSHLEYFGSYETLLKQLINDGDLECIDFRIPDYPDWDLTKKYINEYFLDYV